MHIDDSCRNALFFEHLSCHNSLVHHKTGCDYSHILAVCELNRLAYFKLIVIGIIESRHCKTAETKIYGTLILRSGENSRSRLNIIGGIDYNHTGDGTHESYILAALMARAVLTDGYTRMGSADFDVEMRIADCVSYLLKSTACGEHCKRAGKYSVSDGRKSAGDTYHVALGNAGIKESVRICLFEHCCLSRLCKVCIKNDELIIYGSELYERLAVTVTRCRFYNFCHSTTFLSLKLVGFEACESSVELLHSLFVLLFVRSFAVP